MDEKPGRRRRWRRRRTLTRGTPVGLNTRLLDSIRLLDKPGDRSKRPEEYFLKFNNR